MPDRRGLLVDFGGVLTTSVTRSWRAFCAEIGVPPETLRDVFLDAYADAAGDSPVHLVETGRMSDEEFAAGLADALAQRTGVRIPPEGLLDRAFAQVSLDEPMLAAVAAARAAGIRTGLLSNSWGQSAYPRDRFAGLFDTLVISGEVGLRKPDPAIFLLGARHLGLSPPECVFVDDLDVNVAAAEKVGMAGVVHRAHAETVPQVAALLGIPVERLTPAG